MPTVTKSTIALLSAPIVTGVIGYVTNWTGVRMVFNPVHFRGWRAPWLMPLARLLPHIQLTAFGGDSGETCLPTDTPEGETLSGAELEAMADDERSTVAGPP